jgi:hypothetical protein
MHDSFALNIPSISFLPILHNLQGTTTTAAGATNTATGMPELVQDYYGWLPYCRSDVVVDAKA